LESFNRGFDKMQNKYVRLLGKIVNKRAITFIILIGFCIGAYFLNNSVPAGFIPNEDQGMIYAIIQTPPGST
jgi:HAE1 family hydrophobic/amphiphilic exporter-1